MGIQENTNNLYGSYAMLHPTGKVMCYCSRRKANWYIDKQLAVWKDSPDDKVFQLLFEPQGYGKASLNYYLQPLENKCVVCGSLENLTKHHVVPYMFRSQFPKKLKNHNSHDILMLCVDCHTTYERFADDFKIELANNNGHVTQNSKMSMEERYNKKILSAKTLINRINSGELTNIPEEVIVKTMAIANLPFKEVPYVPRNEWTTVLINKLVVDNKLHEFMQSWRQHFIDHAKPQFLPKHWDIEHPLEKT